MALQHAPDPIANTGSTAAASPGTVNLICGKNQVGLSRDAELLRTQLESRGWQVRDLDPRSRNAYRDRFYCALRLPDFSGTSYPWRADVNLHFEKPFHRWRWTAPINALIPNPEWCPRHLLRNPDNLHVILCKTRHAQRIFSELGCTTDYLGFTSPDRDLPAETPDYNRFLHIAGKSRFKGTQTLLDVWLRHPEWPTLTVIQHGSQKPPAAAHNIETIDEFLSDEELKLMQNGHGIHIYPSSCEGWGHCLVEAMSCAVVILTTNGPPMNEVVEPDRGILVDWHREAPHRLGTDYFVDPDALEKQIQRVYAMSTEEKAALGRSARRWFVSNDVRFKDKLHAVADAWSDERGSGRLK